MTSQLGSNPAAFAVLAPATAEVLHAVQSNSLPLQQEMFLDEQLYHYKTPQRSAKSSSSRRTWYLVCKRPPRLVLTMQKPQTAAMQLERQEKHLCSQHFVFQVKPVQWEAHRLLPFIMERKKGAISVSTVPNQGKPTHVMAEQSLQRNTVS